LIKRELYYTSPNIISILGIKPEDLEGHNVKEFIHPADIEQVLASLDSTNRTNEDYNRRTFHCLKSWRWDWLEAVCVSSNRYWYYLQTLESITDGKSIVIRI
jgi:PAS domain S-box-containing protein